MVRHIVIGCALACAIATPAFAHVTLEQGEASPGAGYKMVLKVPHGCGPSPTVRINVVLPNGFVAVKPMVKPGWQIEMKRATYDKPYGFLHGAKFTEGVKEITWSGGKLEDAFYDEFVVSMFVSPDVKAPQTLYIPVIQTCESGEHKWIEIPKAGEHTSEPAPVLKIVPSKSGHH